MENIKWDVFTLEEKTFIDDIVARKDFDLIAKVISVDSPEKEYWISKILEQVQPISAPVDAKVEKELEVEISKGYQIDSPEKEAEWQKKLDNEKKENVEKVKRARRTKAEMEAAKKEVKK